MDLNSIQRALKASNYSGWLLADFRNREPFAYQLLGLDIGHKSTRRWFYYIPVRGVPVKVVSKVERNKLDSLAGRKITYSTWQELNAALISAIGAKGKRIAMQYSALNRIPYVSTVDAGTVELVRSLGYRVVSSADLLQVFNCRLDQSAYRSHLNAGKVVDQIRKAAFDQIRTKITASHKVTEIEIQQFILKKFKSAGLITSSPPMVGVNSHPADPHFDLSPKNSLRIKRGDTMLIDLWAKFDSTGSIYYDSTWVGFVGSKPPKLYQTIFSVVCAARDAAIDFVFSRLAQGKECHGYEVDRAARKVIERAGFAKYFIHRTGHSISTEAHGQGVNMDDFETRDERLILPGSCFSIEPGIYLPSKMAVRSEINIFVKLNGQPEVSGEVQRELVLI